MRIAIPQLNYTTGNIRKNYEIMLQSIKKATKAGADLIIFPELAVCGPFSRDLLEREAFIEECRWTVDKLAMACTGIAAIIGAPNLDTTNGIMYNSAYFIRNGEVTDGVHKTILSDYDIFDESRYFVAGEDNSAIQYQNQNIRILFDEYESEFIEKTDSFVIHIGITPFTTESLTYRQKTWQTLARKYAKNIISVNPVGAATSVIFDGNSMIYDYKGNLVSQMADFEEDFEIFDTNKIKDLFPVKKHSNEPIPLIHKALISGIRDYFIKNDFQHAVLGLSGGIDSAIVAALTTEALGADRVTGILMPSEFSTDHSVKDATDLAENLGISYQILPIKDIYNQYLSTLSPAFGDLPFNVAEENLQARIRGVLVMAISNKFGYILLNTSNKSEAAVGYGTLYGDLCGSLAVIGDVYKTEIYKLAHYMNRDKIIIPENTITKAPSAELRPNQKDQDSLPDYPTLDAILKLYLEENYSVKDILAQNYNPEIVHRITSLVDRNEYKRNQCPPILKVSKKAFGLGRRIPF